MKKLKIVPNLSPTEIYNSGENGSPTSAYEACRTIEALAKIQKNAIILAELGKEEDYVSGIPRSNNGRSKGNVSEVAE